MMLTDTVRARVVAVGMAACLLAGCVERGDIAFVTESPGGTFRVEVAGNLEASRSIFTDHLVDAVVTRSPNEPFVRAYLYRGGFLDDGFASLFRHPVWPDERVLIFASHMSEEDKIKDIVILRNESGEAFRCVRLEMEDIVLLFEVPNGSAQRLSVSRPTGQAMRRLWIMAWAEIPQPVIDISELVHLPALRSAAWTILLKPGEVQIQQQDDRKRDQWQPPLALPGDTASSQWIRVSPRLTFSKTVR